MYAIQFNLILNKTIFLLQGLVCSSNSNVGHLAGRPDESLSSSISVHLFGSYRQGIFSFFKLETSIFSQSVLQSYNNTKYLLICYVF